MNILAAINRVRATVIMLSRRLAKNRQPKTAAFCPGFPGLE
jgi:hypothetical protein